MEIQMCLKVQMRKLWGQDTESCCAAFDVDMSLIPCNLVKTGEQCGLLTFCLLYARNPEVGGYSDVQK